MLRVSGIAKHYGGSLVLNDVSFVVSAGDRVGLVGPNGCGKSTLLRIMAGQETADAGHVQVDPAVTLGYLPQSLELGPDATVGEVIRAGVPGL